MQKFGERASASTMSTVRFSDERFPMFLRWTVQPLKNSNRSSSMFSSTTVLMQIREMPEYDVFAPILIQISGLSGLNRDLKQFGLFIWLRRNGSFSSIRPDHQELAHWEAENLSKGTASEWLLFIGQFWFILWTITYSDCLISRSGPAAEHCRQSLIYKFMATLIISRRLLTLRHFISSFS